ncbi:MAG: T9SS type A sorting domain-containing protein [Ignavibacteriae bacterium]|nr:T9SS type A sorting domain-containing protein [Ignavibacteriota bacterium]
MMRILLAAFIIYTIFIGTTQASNFEFKNPKKNLKVIENLNSIIVNDTIVLNNQEKTAIYAFMFKIVTNNNLTDKKIIDLIEIKEGNQFNRDWNLFSNIKSGLDNKDTLIVIGLGNTTKLNMMKYDDFLELNYKLNIPNFSEEINSSIEIIYSEFSDENGNLLINNQIDKSLKTIHMIINKSELENVNNIELHQNYPNPFNPKTIIEFSIPSFHESSKNFSELFVYNLLGQKIYNYEIQNLEPGNYKVEFDGSRLSSGIYFYELKSNLYSKKRKMLLIK